MRAIVAKINHHLRNTDDAGSNEDQAPPKPPKPSSRSVSTRDNTENVKAFQCFIPKMVLREIQAFLESGGDNKRKSFSGQEAKRNEFEAAVLFADMSGFTALTERLAGKPNGAEKLCDALNDFFAGLLETVEEYGGDVVKFSGDALQIIWLV